MDSQTIFSCVSIISAVISICVGSLGAAIGEATIAREAMKAIAQQPDNTDGISKTLFVSMAMIESSAIYCLVISMIIIFSNPFWNFFIKK